MNPYHEKIIRLLRKLGLLKTVKKSLVDHKDEVIFKVQEDVIFQVYWKSLSIGTGPAVILKVFNEEILKFDCFGKEKGHYHIAPHYHFRIYFIEETVEEQIHRTIKELEMNGLRYLKMQKDPKIKALNINTPSYIENLKLVNKTLLKQYQKLLYEKKL